MVLNSRSKSGAQGESTLKRVIKVTGAGSSNASRRASFGELSCFLRLLCLKLFFCVFLCVSDRRRKIVSRNYRAFDFDRRRDWPLFGVVVVVSICNIVMYRG